MGQGSGTGDGVMRVRRWVFTTKTPRHQKQHTKVGRHSAGFARSLTAGPPGHAAGAGRHLAH